MIDLARRHIRIVSIALLVGMVFTTCSGPFTLRAFLDGPDGAPLSISPGTGVLSANQTVEIRVSGGYPPYAISVTSGTMEGSVYRAPSASGTTTVTVEDAIGASVSASFVIDASAVNIGISPSSQTVYTGSTVDFSAFGGAGPYEFSLPAGPSGGSIDPATGVYSAGTTPAVDTVRLTDLSDSTFAEATVTVVAKDLAVAPFVVTVYGGQTLTFAAIGGDGPFSYAFEPNPGESGGSINGLTGAYTAGPNPGTDIIRLTDAYDGRFTDATVTVVSPATVTNVDYAVDPITNLITTYRTNAAFTAEALVTNTGAAHGTQNVYWTVYASVDPTIGGADFVVASGVITGGLDSLASQVVAIAGTWPAIPDDYHLIIATTAADDLDLANNVAATSLPRFAVRNPVSISPGAAAVYLGQSIAFSATGGGVSFDLLQNESGGSVHPTTGVYTAGLAPGEDVVRATETDVGFNEFATAAVTVVSPPLPTSVDYRVNSAAVTGGTTTTGGSVNGEITIENIGTAGGAHPISWSVYASADTALSAGDSLIASGSVAAIAASGSVVQPFAGTWPSTPGDYYLVATVSAVDDTQTTNNAGASVATTTIDSPPAPPPGDIDYYVSVLPSGGDRPVGSALFESFTIRNSGTDSGTASLSWRVYLSDDPNLSAGDVLIGSGTIAGGLAAGATAVRSGSGTWPATSGIRHLIVRLESDEDINTANNTVASPAYFVNDPAILDYVASSVSRQYTVVTTGSPVSETFTLTNAGGLAGGADVTWTAHASLTLNPLDGEVIGGGTLAPLGPNSSQVGINITGLCPATPGDYYLIIEVSAPDELAGNRPDYAASPGTIRVNAPPDYEFASVALPMVAYGGNPNELWTDASGVHGGATTHSFEIVEIAGNPGQQSIQWYLYVSDDPVFDAGAQIVHQGLIPPIAASGSSGTITLPGTLQLPPTPGRHYYALKLAAGDDGVPTNDTFTVGPVYVWSTAIASTSITTAPSTHDHFIQLNAGDSVTITGQINTGTNWDWYPVRTGVGVTSLTVELTWATGRDTLDLYAYDATNPQSPIDSSIDPDPDTEPGAAPLPLTPLTQLRGYLIEAYAVNLPVGQQNPGDPYTLVITAP